MWVQSIVLEYHRDISVFWFYIIYHFVTDLEFTACDRGEEPGEHFTGGARKMGRNDGSGAYGLLYEPGNR